MSTAPTVAPPKANWTQRALWLIALGLLANAAIMLYTHLAGKSLSLDNLAFAQAPAPQQMLGARGIYMMPAQLGPQTFGLYLMDIDSQTITVYRANPDQSRLRLMAARSFKYDRFLTVYFNDTASPGEVQKLVETQRKRQEEELKTDQPTVDQSPRKDENAPDAPK